MKAKSKLENMENYGVKSDDYDENHIKIKFGSDNNLPLNETIEIRIVTIVVRAVFHEYNKCYPQIFLNEGL